VSIRKCDMKPIINAIQIFPERAPITAPNVACVVIVIAILIIALFSTITYCLKCGIIGL